MCIANRRSPAPLSAAAYTMVRTSKSEQTATKRNRTTVSSRMGSKLPGVAKRA
jgi:hypothetical protein